MCLLILILRINNYILINTINKRINLLINLNNALSKDIIDGGNNTIIRIIRIRY